MDQSTRLAHESAHTLRSKIASYCTRILHMHGASATISYALATVGQRADRAYADAAEKASLRTLINEEFFS